MSKKFIELLRKESKSSEFITKPEIEKVLRDHDLVLTDLALRQRIHSLTENGYLQKVKRGVYSFKVKPVYSYNFNNEIKKISRIFLAEYPQIEYCIWSQSWLHDFMNLQPFNYSIIFETEADMVESAFNLLRHNNLNAFFNPDINIVQNYTVGKARSIMVRKIVYRSPVIDVKNIKVASIEKILVDIFTDKDIQFFYQGTELKNIFSNAIKRYSINFSALLRYASTRNQKNEIKEFLINKIYIPETLFV